MTRENAVEVLKALWKYKECGYSERKIREALDVAIEALKQEPEKGHWIVAEAFGFGNICECSECKESVWVYKDTDTWNYCPKCGIKMEEKNNKLEKAKEIIKKNFRYGDCGLFESRNVFGDPMHNIYNADGLKIDICFRCGYFEVFGLNDEEFKELEDYYIKLEFESEEK